MACGPTELITMAEQSQDQAATQQGTAEIEVDPAVYQRFEAAREQTEQHDVPKMDQSTFLSHLLDTRKAVRQGYYDDE